MMFKPDKKYPRILLVQSPPWSNLMPPLGIAYLATYLKQHSVKVKVFDLNIEIYNKSKVTNNEIQDIWFNEEVDFWNSGGANNCFRKDIAIAAQKIVEKDIDIIGISVVGVGILFANELIEKIKDLNSNIKIIIGGGGASVKALRDRFIKDKVDYFVVGEGEKPLLAAIKKICSNDDTFIFKDCNIWKDGERDTTICLRTKGEENLNHILYPTFEEFDLSLYEDKLSLPIMGSKGCVNRCVFCQDCQMFEKYIQRDINNIVDEIKYHINCYKRKDRDFVDLLINGNIRRLEEMCERIIKEKIDVRWSGLASVRREMHRKIFKKMKEVGCNHIVFGCESFSPEILKRMRKGFSPDEARANLEAAYEAGIKKIDINLIVGFPGETDEDISQTLKFLEDNKHYISSIGNIGLLQIIPGSYMYYHLDEYNIEPNSINDQIRWYTKDFSNTYEKRRLSGKKYIDKIIELGIPIEKDPNALKDSYKDDSIIRIYTRKATLLVNDRQYKSALKKLQEGLNKFPNSIDLLKILERIYCEEADLLVNDRQYKSALKKLQEGLNKFPNSIDLLKILERIYCETNRWLDTENTFYKILRLNPEDKEIKFELGEQCA